MAQEGIRQSEEQKAYERMLEQRDYKERISERDYQRKLAMKPKGTTKLRSDFANMYKSGDITAEQYYNALQTGSLDF